MLKTKKAFTMVELLVAMAIIGLLIATAIWGIGLAQQGARNTQRREAGAQILAGVTEYFTRFNKQPECIFPKVTGNDFSIVFGNGSNCTSAPVSSKYEIKIAGSSTLPPFNYQNQRLSLTNIPSNGTDANFTEYIIQTSKTVDKAPAGVNIFVCVCMEGGGYSDLSEPQNQLSRSTCEGYCQ